MVKRKKVNNEKEVNSELLTTKKENNQSSDEKKDIKYKSYYIQMASLSKQELVVKEWERLKKKYSEEFKGLTYITQKAILNKENTFFRLMVGKFNTKEEASDFCSKMKMQDICIIKEIL